MEYNIFSQVNFIIFFYFRQGFFGNVVAHDIKYLGVCLSIRKGVL